MEAAFALEQASRHQNVTGLVRLFSDREMARRLAEAPWRALDAHFKAHVVKKSADPFELVMYVVVGRFFAAAEDMGDVAQVLNRFEDFLWLKLDTLYFAAEDKPDWISV